MSRGEMMEREPINLIELLNKSFTEFKEHKPSQKQITDWVITAYQFDYETAKNIGEGLFFLWGLYKGNSGTERRNPRCKKIISPGTMECGKAFVHSEKKNDATGEYIVLTCMGKHITKLRMK